MMHTVQYICKAGAGACTPYNAGIGVVVVVVVGVVVVVVVVDANASTTRFS
jgi:hypothetical protein